MWVELKNLGIRPGMSLFLSGTKVTKFKGFKAGRTHLNFMLTEYGILENNS
jgi:hypothetical protein